MSSDFNTITIHKSRKEHRCALCSEKILKGVTYTKSTGVFSNDFYDEKFHHQCHALLEEYLHIEGSGEFSYDEVLEWTYTYCHTCHLQDADGDCSLMTLPTKCERVRHLLEKENADG